MVTNINKHLYAIFGSPCKAKCSDILHDISHINKFYSIGCRGGQLNVRSGEIQPPFKKEEKQKKFLDKNSIETLFSTNHRYLIKNSPLTVTVIDMHRKQNNHGNF
jgi:hypothetical protein